MPIKEYIVISGIIFITTSVFEKLFKKGCWKWGFLIWLITTFAFVAKNSLLFFALSYFFVVREFNVKKYEIVDLLGIYLLLLPVLPLQILYTIPLPGRQSLFNLNYSRFLNLIFLLPIFLKYSKDPTRKIFSYQLDKFVVVFLLYMGLTMFRDTTITNAFRLNLYLFVDSFLIYFSISRAINNTEGFKKLFYPMLFSALMLALIGIFETIKHWYLYVKIYNIPYPVFGERWSFLRASATFINPIPFGIYFLIIISFTIFLKYREDEKFKTSFNMLITLFTIALGCTISRGPFFGYAIFFIIFCNLYAGKVSRILLILFIIFFLAFIFPPTAKILIMVKDPELWAYRMQLWNNAIQVIKRSPITGSGNFLAQPEMTELFSPSGGMFVDVTNAYLQIALQYGLLGLAFFALILLKTLVIELKLSFVKDRELSLLGKILFSMMVSFTVVIWGVSMLSFLPFYMWILVGLVAAHSKIYAGLPIKPKML